MSIVDQSRQAYNDRDLEAFLAYYDKEIQVFILKSNQSLTSGKEQLKTTMQAAFTTQPRSKTILVSRMEQGKLLISKFCKG